MAGWFLIGPRIGQGVHRSRGRMTNEIPNLRESSAMTHHTKKWRGKDNARGKQIEKKCQDTQTTQNVEDAPKKKKKERGN